VRAVVGYKVCERGHQFGAPFAVRKASVLPEPHAPRGAAEWCQVLDCGCVVHQVRYEWMAEYYARRQGQKPGVWREALGPAQRELEL
jgi:hypothetical protein